MTEVHSYQSSLKPFYAIASLAFLKRRVVLICGLASLTVGESVGRQPIGILDRRCRRLALHVGFLRTATDLLTAASLHEKLRDGGVSSSPLELKDGSPVEQANEAR
jgi:hypothetical protein